jgi:two-component sensor histidine kinase
MLSKISLPVRLGLLVGGSILPLIVFSTVIVYRNYVENREAAFERVLEVVRSTRQILDSETQRIAAGMQVLAQTQALYRDDFEGFRRNAEAFLSQFPGGADIVIAERDGRQVFSTRAMAKDALPFRTSREGRDAVFRTGQPAYSPVFIGSISKAPIITITVPVFRDGKVIYDMSFNPPLSLFQQIIEQQRPGEAWTFSIFDQNGVNFARLPNPDKTIGQRASPTLFQEMFKTREAKVLTVSLEQVPLLTAFTRSSLSGWTVAAGVARATLTEPLLRQLMLTGGIGLVLLLVALAFAIVLAAQLARAEARHSLLVDELNHRVKNTLATVQSLATQTFRNAQDIPDALRRFDARIAAMGRANELLSEANWRNAEMHDIVRHALEPFQASGKERVNASGPAVQLAPHCAVMMAMMLHELATNAAKYGALSNDTGRVDIEWTGTDDRGRLRMSWRELGGPPVTTNGRRGFGTTLIQKGLEGQLGGRAEMDFAPSGLRCTLECPVR